MSLYIILSLSSKLKVVSIISFGLFVQMFYIFMTFYIYHGSFKKKKVELKAFMDLQEVNLDESLVFAQFVWLLWIEFAL